MRQQYIIAHNRALTVGELQRNIPAAFAEMPWSRTSSKYLHVPTMEIISELEKAGFLPHSARQAGTRSNFTGKHLHTKHLITFKEIGHHRDTLTPTIYVLNSSDMSSAYHMGIGLFRAECLNQLLCTLQENYVEYRMRHVLKTSVSAIVEEALKLASSFPRLLETVDRFKRTELSQNNRMLFAESALALRYPDKDLAPYAAGRLLITRRYGDKGTSLWQTLNVVQENITQSNRARYSGQGTSRKVGLVTDMILNKGLWELAGSYSLNT